MPHLWNEEAHRAQAVTVRTYTMYKKNARRNEKYHLDMQDPAYRGMAGESPRLNSIVQETKGMVMMYNRISFPLISQHVAGIQEDVSHICWRRQYTPL